MLASCLMLLKTYMLKVMLIGLLGLITVIDIIWWNTLPSVTVFLSRHYIL